MGLLSKANCLSLQKKLSFSEFILLHDIKVFAWFELNENFYNIVNSVGFDGGSLLSSLSSSDFWDSVCPEREKSYTFEVSNEQNNPLVQFFSFKMKDSIANISIYRTEDRIFMLCNKKFNDKIIDDLENIDLDKDYIDLDKINKTIKKDTILYKFKINFSEAIESYLTLKSSIIKNKKLAYIVISNELYNRFSCRLAKYSTKKVDDNNIIVLINVDKNIRVEHLICHLIFSLEEVIDKSSETINFENLGKAESLIEIKNFFQVG